MRRVATLMVALVLGTAGAVTCVAGWAAADAIRVARSAAGAGPLAGMASARAGAGQQVAGDSPPGQVKVVRYAGYQVEVPVSWPVYRLDRDPAQCVRYDQHALYLGLPAANQQCPAHLAGRVATLGLAPADATAAAGQTTGQTTWQGADWRPARAGGERLLPHFGAGAVVMSDRQDGEVRAVLPPRGLTVTATYGNDAGLMAQVLGTLRWAGGQAAAPSSAGTTRAAQAGTTQAAAPGTSSVQLTPNAAAAGRAGRRHWVKGFDTCWAPSLHVMRRWRNAFSAAAIYLGGPEAACGWGNLSPHWVQATTRIGWSLIPAYVGPQAPCTSFSVRVRPGHAERQGRSSARHAIALAHALGLGRGTPIYDDMEAYDGQHSRCRHPVLAFLDGWTRELHAHGYLSGVYSSASAAPRDLGRATTVYGHPIAKPDSIWFGLWDDRANLSGRPYVRDVWWTMGHRIKQYLGAHRRRVRGLRLYVDSDLVAGAVYRPSHHHRHHRTH